ncbi:MAG: hypothetical protein B7X78_06720 [Sphingomonadales bacterium 39-62-4]|nr:MAG: hypothetical protein B7X78_06720 [Sphingomonadales bacterium 39-62-4]
MPPLTAWSSALIAALVGFGGTVALVVQAMQMLGATVEQTGSAVTALCLGIAVTGAALSFFLRVPVVLAWSTPGAALLAATAPGLSWPVVTGIFLSSGLMMIVLGCIPALGRLIERIPPAIASAMLAGVLLPFCLELFRAARIDPVIVLLLLTIFVVGRSRFPTHTLLLVLAAGFAATLMRGDLATTPTGATFGTFALVAPAFDAKAILSIALPLFLVTLVSQNLPGLIVLRAAGFEPKASPLRVGKPLKIRGAVSLAGINDLAAYRATGPDACGGPDTIDQLTAGAALPDRYADTSPPAFLPIKTPLAVISGALDPIVPPVFGVEFAAKAKGAGDRVEEITIADAGHFELIDPTSAAWTRIVGVIDAMARK